MQYRTQRGPEKDGQGAAEPGEQFVEIVESEALLPAHVTARAAIETVLGTLVGRLTAGEAHQLLVSLPTSVRPMLTRRVHEREGRPVVRLDRAELLASVADALGVAPAHAEQISAAVFTAARAVLPADVQDHVADQLPQDLKDLWRTPGAAISPTWTKVGTAARRDLEVEIENHVPLPPGVSSSAAFSAVMCAFSERLSGGEVQDVVLSLPPSIRELVEKCTLHRGEPGIVFGREGLIDRVAEHLGLDQADALPVISGVFATVKRILPWKEVNDITSQLPTDLRELWLAA
jgi:uncharacterized protein (DUF2267 family)